MSKKAVANKLNFQVRAAFPAESLPFSTNLPSGFTNLNDCVPLVNTLEKSKLWRQRNFGLPPAQEIQVLDSLNNIVELKINGESHLAYQKVVHLVDAYPVLRKNEGYTLPLAQLWSQFDHAQLTNPNNQAYVDATATYLASLLKSHLNSPHFVQFYQAFRCIAEEYRLNIQEDISSYRYSKWFWNSYDAGYFKLFVYDLANNKQLTDEEAMELLRPDPSECEDSEDEEEGGEENEQSELADEEVPAGAEEVDLGSIEEAESISTQSGSAELIHRHTSRSHSASLKEDSDEEEFPHYKIFAILPKMPVIVFQTELMKGIMDDLLNEEEFEDGWEQRWTAWLFQIVAALRQLQATYQMIHNDLHTNNILWIETEKEYFTYKTKEGTLFRIPTFGKRFVIIDFGRATFTFNGIEIASSDFDEGRDAYSQYNYGSFRDPDLPLVRPNPSFDLARLACSLLRALFPENPEEKKGGSILSEEHDWTVRETTSPLFNMIWTWLVDSNGENILETWDGTEKFPGFDLYQHIAVSCKRARPEDWLQKPIFKQFVCKSTGNECVSSIP